MRLAASRLLEARIGAVAVDVSVAVATALMATLACQMEAADEICAIIAKGPATKRDAHVNVVGLAVGQIEGQVALHEAS